MIFSTPADQKKLKRFLGKANKNKVLAELPELHNRAFEKVNCLECAACCRNYSPRFKTPDIRRIAKHLAIKESELIDRYLKLDEDGDYVTKNQPCPFLANDNTCNIYDVRPSDCRRFPYTDEDVLIRRTAITLKNASFCGAAGYVLQQLMAKENDYL